MVSTWLLIAAACFAATGFGAYIAVAACRKLMDAQQQKFEERLSQLQTQLNTVSRGAIGVWAALELSFWSLCFMSSVTPKVSQAVL